MAVWLYGFATYLPEAASGLRGIEPEHPPRAVPVPGGVAVVSDVDADAVARLGTATTLSDLQALQPRILRHVAVQRAVHAAVPFLPTAFGAVWSDEGALVARCEGSGGALTEGLCTVGAAVEIAVKAWVGELDAGGQGTQVGSGAAWLLAKKAASEAKKSRSTRRRQALDALAAELDAACRDATSLPLPVHMKR